jgi:uncharacterized repeat protein (TIGR01451 family)
VSTTPPWPTPTADSDDDAAVDDVAQVSAAPEGSTVTFKNVVTNGSAGTDRFNITVTSVDYPAGTTFLLYKSDGVTPLADSNGDGIRDTGPMAAGGTYDVYVKVTLPPNSADAADGGDGYQSTITATSVFDPSVTDTVTDELVDITASTVDLTNDESLDTNPAALGAGIFAAGEAAAQDTQSVTPTDDPNVVTFSLWVNNLSALSDSYDLAASTDSGFAAITLPAGWSVSFYLDDGNGTRDAGDALVANTGAVGADGAANDDVLVFAEVRVPQNFAAGTYDIYFRARSPSTGAADVKHDAVTVDAIHSLAVTPNNTGQVFPGGTVVYTHTLQNAGNVAQTNITVSTSDDQTGWSSVVYEDTNGNGSLDAGDSAIAAPIANLAARASQTLFVKVFAPPGAAEATVNTTTLTATNANDTATATDISTVIVGDLALEKKQALDAACDGTPDAAYATTQVAAGAVPGACILYQITATNSGSGNVTSVVVSDATPTFTTYNKCTADACAANVTVGAIDGSSPSANGDTGTVKANVGTLTPGQSAVLTFGVKIDDT